MKKTKLKLILACLSIISYSELNYAQTAEKKWGLGIHAGFYEYNGDLGNDFFKFKNPQIAPSILLAKYINPSFDIEGLISYGNLGYSKSSTVGFSGKLMDINVYGKFKFNNGKILKENAVLAPYLFVGLGDAKFKSVKENSLEFNFPAGLGVKVRLGENVSFRVQSAFHYSLSDFYDNVASARRSSNDQFFYHSIGIVFNLGKKDTDHDGISDKFDKCPETPLNVVVNMLGCPTDKDGDSVPDYLDKCIDVKGSSTAKGCPDADADGILDQEDKCPTTFGLASLAGCPDTDGDGIADKDDNCPGEKGLSQFQGCPDSDGDGITDKDDKCPSVKGLAQFSGCTDTDGDGISDSDDQCISEKGSVALKGCPDTDNDGIANKDDRCPAVPGTFANKGCPEVSKEVEKVLADALKGVQFESGKDVIKNSSYGILNNVVKVMKDNTSYKLAIEGHTDSQGDDQKNLLLSQNRANAVKKFLSDKGLDAVRMTATGFGETKPIDTNETVKGRTKNRRVEFKIEF